MHDDPDHSSFDDLLSLTGSAPELERACRRFVTARVSSLAEMELHLLERAVKAPDDDSARRLEARADTAWRDAVALIEEHDEDPSSRLGQAP